MILRFPVKYLIATFWVFLLSLFAFAAALWPGERPIIGQPRTYTQTELTFFRDVEIASRILTNHGCDLSLAEPIARHSLAANLPTRIVAAQVVAESNCNPDAVSDKSAVGLLQVMPYHNQYGDLFDPEVNLHAGTCILAAMIAKYGPREGLKRYCGRGPAAEYYVRKVLRIAEE